MSMNHSKNLFLAVAIITCTVLLGSACTSHHTKKTQKAQMHTEIGIAYLKSKNFTAALREFLEAEKINQRDPEIYYFLGISYQGKGLTKRAIKDLKKAIAVRPDYSEAHNYLGSIYLETGLYDDAIEEFEKALSNILYETPAISLYNMGMSYHKKGDYKTALEKYAAALREEPNTSLLPVIQMYMGIAYMDDNKMEKATYYLEESLTTAPNMTDAHYYLGLSYLKRKKIRRAIKELKTAYKINPESEFGQKARTMLDTIGACN